MEKVSETDPRHQECFRKMTEELIGFPRIEVMFKVKGTPVVMSYGLEDNKWQLLGVDHGGYKTRGTPNKPEIKCGLCFKPIDVEIPDLKERIESQVEFLSD